MRLPGMSPLTSRLPPIDILQLPDIGNIDIGPASTLNIDISQLRRPHCRQWYRGRIIIVGRDNCRLGCLWNFPPPATNQWWTRWSESWASSDWKSHLARNLIKEHNDDELLGGSSGALKSLGGEEAQAGADPCQQGNSHPLSLLENCLRRCWCWAGFPTSTCRVAKMIVLTNSLRSSSRFHPKELYNLLSDKPLVLFYHSDVVLHHQPELTVMSRRFCV